MLEEELAGVTAIFKENGYSILNKSKTRIIKKRGFGGVVGFILSLIMGSALILLGLLAPVHFTIPLAGIFCIGFPILYDRWRYPRKIVINYEDSTLTLFSGFTYVKRYRFSDISGINVDEDILSSDTSPFKEGYRDFIYSFNLKVANSRIKLIKFLYRKENESQVEQIFKFFSNDLKIG